MPDPRQTLLAVLSMYALLWMLLGWESDHPRSAQAGSGAAGPLPPPAGTAAQEAAYQQALAEIAAYSSSTDSFGCPSEPFVTVGSGPGGRLGGALAEYATLWACWRRFGLRGWLLPAAYDRLAAHFSVSLPPLPSHCEPRFQSCTMRSGHCLQMRDKARRNIWIEPGAHDVALYATYRLELRRELQLPAAARRAAQLRIQQFRRRDGRAGVTLIGVHVRRTDHETWLAQRGGGRLLGADYFRRAMEHFRRRHGACLFLVVSDDTSWCREQLRAADVVMAGSGSVDSPISDLALLVACQHTVLSYGAFGFFAALLAGGEVVVPANSSDAELPLSEQLRWAENMQITFVDMNDAKT